MSSVIKLEFVYCVYCDIKSSIVHECCYNSVGPPYWNFIQLVYSTYMLYSGKVQCTVHNCLAMLYLKC